MLKITEEFINSIAPNQNAVTNGLGLVKKNSFVKLYISKDETVLFGECKGSGASNYITSADFINQESPVYRCTCPSRQFPCKHSIGLLFAYANGKSFEEAEIPKDIIEKREKIEQREEKKKVEVEKGPKKVNKSALKKKLLAQLEGLELLEKIIGNFAQAGLGTINAKTIQIMNEQVKQLGNYYLTGPQIMLKDFLLLFNNISDHEKIYSQAIDLLITMNSLCKKGKEYLNKRLEEASEEMQKNDLIPELLGHAWQLSELRELGQVQNDVELVQLAFNSFSSEARMEYVDLGIWINLKTGEIQQTFNYRPFKAAKYIREDDSFYKAAKVKELFIYPGELNPRIRWESMEMRDVSSEDYKLIKSYAKKSYTEVIKTVKNQIKNPLSDKNPLVLINFTSIGKVDGLFAAEDEKGQRLVLEDNLYFEPRSTYMLELVEEKVLSNNCVLVRFHQSPDTGKLRAQPLGLITDDGIIRLI